MATTMHGLILEPLFAVLATVSLSGRLQTDGPIVEVFGLGVLTFLAGMVLASVWRFARQVHGWQSRRRVRPPAGAKGTGDVAQGDSAVMRAMQNVEREFECVVGGPDASLDPDQRIAIEEYRGSLRSMRLQAGLAVRGFRLPHARRPAADGQREETRAAQQTP